MAFRHILAGNLDLLISCGLSRMMLFFGSGSRGRKYGVCIASLASACLDARMVKKLCASKLFDLVGFCSRAAGFRKNFLLELEMPEMIQS